MSNKRKLLMISRLQFGYHTDMVVWSRYLSTQYSITILCVDQNYKRIEMDGVEVIYINSNNGISLRLDFFKAVKRIVHKFHFIVVDYYVGCSMLLTCCKKPDRMIVDIRTVSVRQSTIRRIITNTITTLEALLYPAITVISEPVRNYLHLPVFKTKILPLGANNLPTSDKSFTTVHLLYVGTFTGRHIEQTIHGLSIFMENNMDLLDVQYTIVGGGTIEETRSITESIKRFNLENIVRMEGYVLHDQLLSYYERATVGVSYVPITSYYTIQPPTKTYEYLGAGMAVLATKTLANSDIINGNNGVLIEDTPQAFASGLQQIIEKFSSYDSDVIKKTIEVYQWKHICADLLNYLYKNA